MPVNAISRQCDADFGSGIFFALMITKTIAAESRNRVAANPTGGRSPSPIFIKIQVVPQIRQRISQTMVRVPRTLRSLEKAQARLALFQNAPPSQVARRIGDVFLRVMFDHENAAVVYQTVIRVAKIGEGEAVVRVIGRIEKSYVPAARMRTAGKGLGGQADDLSLIFGNLELVQIFLDQSARTSGTVDKRHECGATRDGLDSYRSRAGAEVEKSSLVVDLRRKDVEKGFAQPV